MYSSCRQHGNRGRGSQTDLSRGVYNLAVVLQTAEADRLVRRRLDSREVGVLVRRRGKVLLGQRRFT